MNQGYFIEPFFSCVVFVNTELILDKSHSQLHINIMLHGYIQYIALYAIKLILKNMMVNNDRVLTFTFVMKLNYTLLCSTHSNTNEGLVQFSVNKQRLAELQVTKRSK